MNNELAVSLREVDGGGPMAAAEVDGKQREKSSRVWMGAGGSGQTTSSQQLALRLGSKGSGGLDYRLRTLKSSLGSYSHASSTGKSRTREAISSLSQHMLMGCTLPQSCPIANNSPSRITSDVVFCQKQTQVIIPTSMLVMRTPCTELHTFIVE